MKNYTANLQKSFFSVLVYIWFILLVITSDYFSLCSQSNVQLQSHLFAKFNFYGLWLDCLLSLGSIQYLSHLKMDSINIHSNYMPNPESAHVYWTRYHISMNQSHHWILNVPLRKKKLYQLNWHVFYNHLTIKHNSYLLIWDNCFRINKL